MQVHTARRQTIASGLYAQSGFRCIEYTYMFAYGSVPGNATISNNPQQLIQANNDLTLLIVCK
jgi:hypothetical protein